VQIILGLRLFFLHMYLFSYIVAIDFYVYYANKIIKSKSNRLRTTNDDYSEM